jgi:hypothetical protein
MPRDTADAVMLATLGISGTFTSQWYPRHPGDARAQAHFYGDAALAANGLEVQETWDDADANTATVHRTSTVGTTNVTLEGASRFTASLDARIVGRFWRVKVTNGGTAQTVAKLWGQVSSQ